MSWMRNKPEPESRPAYDSGRTEPNAPPRTPAPTAERENRMDKSVNIGKTVEIKGELNGTEDLSIEGKFEGKVTLRDHQLTVGANGRIKGEIFAKSVTVIGEVDGNIVADDKVEVAATGSMKGDLTAPRVLLADGAQFKGSIDMERRPQGMSNPAPQKQPAMAAAAGGGKN